MTDRKSIIHQSKQNQIPTRTPNSYPITSKLVTTSSSIIISQEATYVATKQHIDPQRREESDKDGFVVCPRVGWFAKYWTLFEKTEKRTGGSTTTTDPPR